MDAEPPPIRPAREDKLPLLIEIERAAGAIFRDLGMDAVAGVPWNAPYYERLGFHALPEPDVPAGLRAVREHEAARGLDAWPRVVMVRALRSSHPRGTD
jgi:hypothetical protein